MTAARTPPLKAEKSPLHRPACILRFMSDINSRAGHGLSPHPALFLLCLYPLHTGQGFWNCSVVKRFISRRPSGASGGQLLLQSPAALGLRSSRYGQTSIRNPLPASSPGGGILCPLRRHIGTCTVPPAGPWLMEARHLERLLLLSLVTHGLRCSKSVPTSFRNPLPASPPRVADLVSAPVRSNRYPCRSGPGPW